MNYLNTVLKKVSNFLHNDNTPLVCIILCVICEIFKWRVLSVFGIVAACLSYFINSPGNKFKVVFYNSITPFAAIGLSGICMIAKLKISAVVFIVIAAISTFLSYSNRYLKAAFIIVCAVFLVITVKITPKNVNSSETSGTGNSSSTTTFFEIDDDDDDSSIGSRVKTESTCPTCGGKKKVKRTGFAPNYGDNSRDTSYTYEEVCPTCQGSGKVDY